MWGPRSSLLSQTQLLDPCRWQYGQMCTAVYSRGVAPPEAWRQYCSHLLWYGWDFQSYSQHWCCHPGETHFQHLFAPALLHTGSPFASLSVLGRQCFPWHQVVHTHLWIWTKHVKYIKIHRNRPFEFNLRVWIESIPEDTALPSEFKTSLNFSFISGWDSRASLNILFHPRYHLMTSS